MMRSRYGYSSRRGGVLKPALFLAVFIGAATSLLWMILLPKALEAYVEDCTGFEYSAASVAGNPFAASLVARDAKLINPAGFGKGTFLDITRLELEIDALSLRSKQARIPRLKLEARELTLVYDGAGRENAATFFSSFCGIGVESCFLREVEIRVERVHVVNLNSFWPSRKTYRAGSTLTFQDMEDWRDILDALLPDGVQLPQ